MATQCPENPNWRILELDSALGNPLDNRQICEQVPPNIVAMTDAQYLGTLGVWHRTTVCSAGYNCHGLVFAARRTCIDEPSTVRYILAQDSYRTVGRDALLPGDIVLYVIQDKIEHSGIVVDIGKIDDVTRLQGDPMVVSKWGKWREVVHQLRNCPWGLLPDVEIEYHRMDHAPKPLVVDAP